MAKPKRPPPRPPRARIVEAALALLAEGGREAVTTRAVSHAAGVQAPTIYRQFGDMRGLLDAVASHGFAAYLRQKTAGARAADPVDELRRGWDLHVAFGLANPAVYALMYADPHGEPAAAREAEAILRGLVGAAAAAGRLRVREARAVDMIQAAGAGLTLRLIRTPPDARDPALSAAVREAVLAAVTTDAADAPADAPASTGADDAARLAQRAVALKAVLPAAADALTPGEAALLAEWLDRLATSA